MPSIIGRRNRWLGTGRVMSQIRMQALRRPCASVANGGAPTGRASASRTAARGSGSLGSGGLPMTVARAPAGSGTRSPVRP